MLEGVCKAITSPGEYQLDAVWAWGVGCVPVLPSRRPRAPRDTPLTDVDYQTAQAFEMYGRAESRAVPGWKRRQSGGGRKRSRRRDPPRRAWHWLPQRSWTWSTRLPTRNRRRWRPSANEVPRAARPQALQIPAMLSGGMAPCAATIRPCLPLIAHSKQAAGKPRRRRREADGGVLNGGIELVIRGISEQNAEASAKALVPFVGATDRARTDCVELARQGVSWYHPHRGRSSNHHAALRTGTRTIAARDAYQDVYAGPWRACNTPPERCVHGAAVAVGTTAGPLERCGAWQAWRAAFLTHGSDGIGRSGAAPPHCTVGCDASTISAAIKLCVNASQQQIG